MIRDRYSVRDFKDIEVSDDIIKELLITASQAPSACCQQPWEFYVVKNQEILNKLANATPYTKPILNTKQAIVFVYKKDTPHKKYVLEDMSACVENFLLELLNYDLGGVWMGISPDEEKIKIVNNIINLDKNYDTFCIVAFGYPKEKKEVKLRFKDSMMHYIR